MTVDALFEQAGVIRTDSLGELLGVASLLTSQPVPRGDRVAIVTNAGGLGVMCADACQANGVEVPELPAAVRSKLGKFLPAAASLGNPVDMIASATAEDYGDTIRTLIDGEACDAILAIFVPPLVTEANDVAVALRAVAESDPGVAIAAVFMTAEGPPAELGTGAVKVPGFEYPEDAARAVALAAAYGRWRAQPAPTVRIPDGIRMHQATAVISRELANGSDWLAPTAVGELLDCYGLPVIATRVVPDVAGAVAAATEIDGPVY